jgi:HNH endonuclease
MITSVIDNVNERFWQRVWNRLEKLLPDRPENACWEWQGYKTDKGYGQLSILNKSYMAHRLIYELFIGSIPDELVIDHLCRNRSCCNPTHLEAVTDRENLLRGNGWGGINSRKTHCPKNHPLTNLGKRGRGCLICLRERDARNHHRARQIAKC